MTIPEYIPGLPLYDKTGAEITVEQHMRLFGDPEYKQVALWRDDNVTVSTVWLGINGALWENRPHPFETMLFSSAGAERTWRYPTEEDALAGHDLIVAWVRDGMPEVGPVNLPL